MLRSNRQSTFSPLTPFLPLPKYFESEWSYAQYRIPVQSSHISLSANPAVQSPVLDPPDEERCVVGWIQYRGTKNGNEKPASEYQLIALTYTGGWYRLSLPRHGDLLKGSGTSSSPPKHFFTSGTRTSSGSSFSGRTDKGKEKETDKEGRSRTDCVLEEFRRYGRWDGWG